jgi:hypothetical protein
MLFPRSGHGEQQREGFEHRFIFLAFAMCDDEFG